MKQKLVLVNKLLDLSGKTAIVTGGAKGIGLGIVIRLAQAGAKVLIADFDEFSATLSERKLTKQGLMVKSLKIDVGSESDINKMIKVSLKEFGNLDIMVNNAGIFPQISLSKMTKEDFDQVISINLRSVFLCTKLASKQMIEQGKGGKIINITSIDAIHPSMIGLSHYDASKHGVWGFTKTSALELAPHKIWVNAIAPGGIATPGVAAMSKTTVSSCDMKKVMEGFLEQIPMKRIGEPDDIGKVALFLASDMSSYMTGEQIVVDGGKLLK